MLARTVSLRRRLLGRTALLVATVSGLLGFMWHPSPAAAKVKSWTFVVGNTTAVDTLNPFLGYTNTDYEAYGLIWDNLMDYNQQPPYQGTPRLATSWSVSKNKLVWTYHIRHGVRWSDGVPLTAADVAYTFKRNIVPGSTEFNDNSSYVQNITKVRQTGPYTVQMTVSKPTPGMSQLEVPILPKHIWEHIPEKKVSSYNPSTAVGSGPFIVTSFVPNQSITLKRNPHYWGGEPGIKKVVFEPFANPSAEAFALENGSIDFAEGLTNQLYVSLKHKPGVTVVPGASDSFDELAFNTGAATIKNLKIGNGNPALKDVKVRQALSWAMDTPQLVRKVFLGYASPGTSVIPTMYTGLTYHPPANIAYHYDPVRADQLLTAAGWKMGPGGVRVKDGKQLSLRLFIRSESPQNEQDAPYIKAWLQDVGVKVDERLMSDSQLTNAITNGDYDLFVWGWGVEPNPDFQLSVFTCGQRSYGKPGNLTAGWSDSYYCNKHYDAMFDREQILAGTAKQRLVQTMQRQLYVQAPYRVLYSYNDVQAYRSDLFTGYAPMPYPNGLYLFQPEAWWSYRCIRPVGTSPSLTDHNLGCAHTVNPTGTQLRQGGVTTSPLSGTAVVVILALVLVGGFGVWFVYERYDAATAARRE
ncbi:MAG TPA: ABC transporter substrate-binding protein [Solirubrobacteraceae bacterium]|nr:ABC transporter substrate-binding protein [Solirubrobacteraceae bacterium]